MFAGLLWQNMRAYARDSHPKSLPGGTCVSVLAKACECPIIGGLCPPKPPEGRAGTKHEVILSILHYSCYRAFGPANTLSVKGVLGAQPLGYTAEVDLWHRGPSRAPISHESQSHLKVGWLE